MAVILIVTCIHPAEETLQALCVGIASSAECMHATLDNCHLLWTSLHNMGTRIEVLVELELLFNYSSSQVGPTNCLHSLFSRGHTCHFEDGLLSFMDWPAAHDVGMHVAWENELTGGFIPPSLDPLAQDKCLSPRARTSYTHDVWHHPHTCDLNS